MWISDEEFQLRHSTHINSWWWKTLFRPRVLKHYSYRCAVCGRDYEKKYSKYQLIVDHKTYRLAGGALIFGYERLKDVRLLCPDHNQKGVRSDAEIKAVKLAYRYRKHRWRRRVFRGIAWLIRWGFRLTVLLVRLLLEGGRMLLPQTDS